MKKYIYGLMILALSFASCTDQEEIEISYKAQLTISAAHIFDSFHPMKSNDFDMLSGNWSLNIHSYIYDENGNLIDQQSEKFSSLSGTISECLNYVPGKYTIIAVSEFSSIIDNKDYHYWNISNEEKLNDLSITENPVVYATPFEMLGLTVHNFTVSEKTLPIAIDIQPATCLVDVIMADGNYTGWNSVSDYSRICPVALEYYISTTKKKDNIRFVNGQPEANYSSQLTSFVIGYSEPNDKWINNKAPISYNYRALLPEENIAFEWEIYEYPDIAGNKDAFGNFDKKGKSNQIPKLNAGQQYTICMILDLPGLFLNETDDNISINDFINAQVYSVVNERISSMVEFNYHSLIGLTESQLNAYLDMVPYSHNDASFVAYYPHSHSSHFETFVTVRHSDPSYTRVDRIMLSLPNLTQATFDELVNCLNEKYTPYSNIGNVYQFIDKSTISESSCGITLDGQNFENASLFFDIIEH